jgi:hypothetical protein
MCCPFTLCTADDTHFIRWQKINNRSGTYKVRNEIETKRNEINENETKRNEINEMETKWNETNEIDWYEENGRTKIKDKTK